MLKKPQLSTMMQHYNSIKKKQNLREWFEKSNTEEYEYSLFWTISGFDRGKLNKILENLGKCLYSLSGHLLWKQILA